MDRPQDPTGTTRVQPWGQEQGDYVLVNTADLDPQVHTAWVEPAAESAEEPAAEKPAPKKPDRAKN